MQRTLNERVHKLLRGIPVFGGVFRVANAYAYEGDGENIRNIAPLKLWWERVFRKAWYVLLFVSAISLLSSKPICLWEWEPSDTILGAFPSILGFGIGVYALMFIMPSDFLSFLNRRYKSGESSVSPKIVPVDLGFPLIVYVLVMFVAAINKVFPEPYQLRLLSLWALFYGLAITVELILFLFSSSNTIQLIRSEQNSEDKND